MSRPLVGVLGGMGPEATITLQQRLLQAVEAHDDADHLPLLIDMNPQVPSRIAHLIDGRGVDPGPVLAAMARRLHGAGATALAMPCNTAHHYAPEISAAVPIPLLNMVALSVRAMAARMESGGYVGMLASPAVRRAGVFMPLLEQVGLRVLWPADEAPLLDAIRTIKARGPVPEARLVLARTAADLAEAGADLLCVACTEFSLIVDAIDPVLPYIDTLDVLVAAIRAHTQDI